MRTYQVAKNASVLWITVDGEGTCAKAESPTHPCFRDDLIAGRPWDEVEREFRGHGFTVTLGN